MRLRILFVTAFALSSGGAFANSGEASAPPAAKPPVSANPARTAETPRGRILVDPAGMALYTFAKDDSGNKSNCDGACAEQWRPFLASDAAKPNGDFTLITRRDGGKMWAYRYRPLYTWHADKAPGEDGGEDSPTGLWVVARPE